MSNLEKTIMAADKLIWILCMSTLVACVLISPLACTDGPSSETPKEKLISQLEMTPPEPWRIERMFEKYASKNDVIYNYAVEEWAQLCQCSTSRCSRKELDLSYYRLAPKLFKYRMHCLDKLKQYCLDNFGQVGKSYFEKMSEQNRELALYFVKSYRETKDRNEKGDGDSTRKREMMSSLVNYSLEEGVELHETDISLQYIGEAYLELMNSEYGSNGISIDQRKQFLAKVYHVFEYLVELNSLEKEITDYGEKKPEPEGVNELNDEFRYVAQISQEFVYFLCYRIESKIYQDASGSEGMQEEKTYPRDRICK